MKIALNDSIIENVIKKLQLEFNETEEKLEGVGPMFTVDDDGHFFFDPEEEAANSLKVIDIPMGDIFVLEQFQDPICFEKRTILVEGDKLTLNMPPVREFWQPDHEGKEVFAFIRREDAAAFAEHEKKNLVEHDKQDPKEHDKHGSKVHEIQDSKVHEIQDLIERDKHDLIPSLDEIKYYQYDSARVGSRRMRRADVMLMIPGFVEHGWSCSEMPSEISELYISVMEQNVINEYSDPYVMDHLKRYQLGQVFLKVRHDYVEKDENGEPNQYKQKAFAMLVEHELTGFCVLEIMAPNVCIGGNKLLAYYCVDELAVWCSGKWYDNADKLLEALGVKRCGEKRSAVFAYDELSQKDLVLALANEEYAIAEITGSFAKKYAHNNIAQFDVAEVYIAPGTMVQKRKSIPRLYYERLEDQVMEIFFVELILLLDAGISKQVDSVNYEHSLQLSDKDPNDAIRRMEDISFDMVGVMRFADFNSFKYQSVKLAAREVAEAFGVESLFQKYHDSKDLLEELVAANVRRTDERENRIKNRFLLLITIVTTIATLGEIIYNTREDLSSGIMAYAIATGITAVSCLIYLVISNLSRKKNRKTDV